MAAKGVFRSPSEAHPLITDRFQRSRGVFSPGHRMRMNIVPVFLNAMVPVGVFVFCCAMTSIGGLMYTRPLFVKCCIALVGLCWLLSVAIAIWARWHEPDPSWFTYSAMSVGVAFLLGTFAGYTIFTYHTKPYFQLRDLKVSHGIDASRNAGMEVNDAGILHFRPGSHVDYSISWHFKSRSLYCVAPIISNTSQVPFGQTYDFWAVGKDCCSMTAADFRCGSWGHQGSTMGGIRVVDEDDAAMYRLAVKQTASLYNIMAPLPIFVEWSVNPELEALEAKRKGFRIFTNYCVFAFICSLFSVAVALARFSFMGRGKSADYLDDTNWNFASFNKPIDWSVQAF
mmetsp:Transcript_70452/g.139788  ORF Transcript_70452/g.139788 Transcript_70452/m.139788 type:complete len:341 (+) Transcript_70452:72-1094(+)